MDTETFQNVVVLFQEQEINSSNLQPGNSLVSSIEDATSIYSWSGFRNSIQFCQNRNDFSRVLLRL